MSCLYGVIEDTMKLPLLGMLGFRIDIWAWPSYGHAGI